jgi:hypothetical protein
MNLDAIAYYRSHGEMTDPGLHLHLYDRLPDTPGQLVHVIHGLLLHGAHAWRYKVSKEDAKSKRSEVNLRSVGQMLDCLLRQDDSPLTTARPPAKRLIVCCRHFALLLCSLLRHCGIPARVRAGFGTYFGWDGYENHWICQYWNAPEQRWVSVDAELDEVLRKALAVDFDPLDLPPGKFITGGEALRMCRCGQARPEKFGLHKGPKGLFMVHGLLLHDVLTLNKVELLPWDGVHIKTPLDQLSLEQQQTLLERLASLTDAPDRSFGELRHVWEHELSSGAA